MGLSLAYLILNYLVLLSKVLAKKFVNKKTLPDFLFSTITFFFSEDFSPFLSFFFQCRLVHNLRMLYTPNMKVILLY